MKRRRLQTAIVSGGLLSALAVFGFGLRRAEEPAAPPAVAEAAVPVLCVRAAPASFALGSSLPDERESRASGGIDLESFSAGRDLVYLDDPRVWWESDNDRGDSECDHSVHVNLREPLERLIELVARRGGTLKVQDAYRPEGVHSPNSLHREGRAVDLTGEGISIEEIACLAWAAGFDWVYHEKGNRRNGPHVHASVRR